MNLTLLIPLIIIFMAFFLKDSIGNFETFTDTVTDTVTDASTNKESNDDKKDILKYNPNDIDRSYNMYNNLPSLTSISGILGEAGASLSELSLNSQQELSGSSLNRYQKITDSIPDSYLPYTEDISENDDKIKSYYSNIIEVYAKILNREPTKNELNINSQQLYNKEIDEELLITKLMNTPEYEIIVNMQSNSTNPLLKSAVSTDKLLKYLTVIYNKTLNKDLPNKMLLPLRDCYIHLQFNDYLFIAMLLNGNYYKFEKDVLEARMLSKELLLELFNKYFILLDLKNKANQLKKDDILNRKGSIINEPDASGTANDLNNNCKLSSIDKDSSMDSENHIQKIVKDGNNIFNININLDDKNRNTSMPFKRRPFTNEEGDTTRIYNPIDYKQHYRGQSHYVPPVCTTAGTKNIVQPVFLNSKLLLSATDLDEAANNTGMGSIMPKFEYREYEEVPKK